MPFDLEILFLKMYSEDTFTYNVHNNKNKTI